MSNQDVLVSGTNWSVTFNKSTSDVICSFNNEEDSSQLVNSDGMISYCSKCNRFFDVRSGCEEDIRDDERTRITTKEFQAPDTEEF